MTETNQNPNEVRFDFIDYYEAKMTELLDPEDMMDDYGLYRELIRIEFQNYIGKKINKNKVLNALIKLEESLSTLHDLLVPLYFDQLESVFNPDAEVNEVGRENSMSQE